MRRGPRRLVCWSPTAPFSISLGAGEHQAGSSDHAGLVTQIGQDHLRHVVHQRPALVGQVAANGIEQQVPGCAHPAAQHNHGRVEGVLRVETPDGQISTVTVRGQEATLIDDGLGHSFLTWTEGEVTITIAGQIGADEAISVAESLQ